MARLVRAAAPATRGRRHWPALFVASLGLAACGTPPGSFDEEQTTQAKWSNLMAMVEFKKLPGQPDPASKVVCPDISILDGTADDRVYGTGGQTNANVRYQFSLKDVARDCKVTGGQLGLRVGVAGNVLLGPLGSPGTFDAPVRIAVVQKSDQSAVFSKLYKVAVTIPAGGSEAPFTLVADDLSIPYPSAAARHDYMIEVGFDPAGNDSKPGRKNGRRGHHRGAAASTD